MTLNRLCLLFFLVRVVGYSSTYYMYVVGLSLDYYSNSLACGLSWHVNKFKSLLYYVVCNTHYLKSRLYPEISEESSKSLSGDHRTLPGDDRTCSINSRHFS